MDSGSRSAKRSSSGMTGPANCDIVPKRRGDFWELSNRHFNELTNLLIEVTSHLAIFAWPDPISREVFADGEAFLLH